jgi:hypothetical protein
MSKILIAMYALAVIMSAQSTGAISGTLKSNGSPVGGAVVSAYLQAPGTSGNFPPVFNALTGTDGSFTVNALPAGKYLLCAEKASAALLNPCFWSASANTVTVAPAGKVSGVSLTAQTGVAMNIRIEDPNGLLTSNPSLDDIVIGVKPTNGISLPVPVSAHDSGGRTMTMVVPQGAPANFLIYSANLSLKDGQGDSFSSPNVGVTVNAPSATGAAALSNSPSLTLTIQGKHP